jgi:hypothetical protein
VLFRNKKDSSVKRGAIQKSLVVFSYKPYFTTWKPLMKITLEKYKNLLKLRIINNEIEPTKALKSLYESLSNDVISKELTINLYNEKFILKIPK